MLQLCLSLCGLVSLHFNLQTPRVVQPAPPPHLSGQCLVFQALPAFPDHWWKLIFPRAPLLAAPISSRGADPDLGPRASVQRFRISWPPHTKAWSPLTASSPGPGPRAHFPFPPNDGQENCGSEGPAQVPQGGRSEGLVQRSRSWSLGGFLSHQGSFPGVRWPFFPRAPPFVPWSGRD